MSLQTIDLTSLFLEALEETEYSRRTKSMLLSVFKNIEHRIPEVLDLPEGQRKEKLAEIIIDAGYGWGTVGKVLPFLTQFLSSSVFQNTNPSIRLSVSD